MSRSGRWFQRDMPINVTGCVFKGWPLRQRVHSFHIFVRMISFIVLLLLGVSAAEKCPEQYARLSDQHSYCLPKNDQCTILKQGIHKKDRELILKRHNEWRNKVAMGDVGRSDLPTASDMIELVWDNEIASIAQKWVDQCNFAHDCNLCRSTADYQVGQNLGQDSPITCETDGCSGHADKKKKEGNWKVIVDMWYNEISEITASLTNKFVFAKGYGHYSQLAWAKTWRVGCGFTSYLDGNAAVNLYGCNYSPAGNGDNEPIYQSGSACSNCPTNSQCSSQFPGLCKLNDPMQAPVYPDPMQYIFNCDFSDNNPDCAYNGLDGVNKWVTEGRLWGNVLSAKMKSGETSTLHFAKTISPSQAFCMIYVVRKGPNVAGQEDNNVATTNIQQPPSMPSWVVDVGMSNYGWFVPLTLPLFYADTTISLTFTVPDGAPAQFIEVKRIYAYYGNCG